MYNCTQMVAEMCLGFDHPVNFKRVFPDDAQQKLRKRLILSEQQETIDAITDEDLTELADGLADIVVVVVGTYLAFGLPVYEPIWLTPPQSPHLLPEYETDVLLSELKSRYNEVQLAFDTLETGNDPELELVHGALDRSMATVAITAYRFGIDFMPVFREVHRSNMQKIGPDGKVKKDAGGKVIKPEGFVPPNVVAELSRQAHLFNK